MDSRTVVGVGNIYASEALFRSGIHPLRKAGNISLARYGALVASIRDVLNAALEKGGTTLRDFVGGDGAPGYFRLELDVYDRAGEPCRNCRGSIRQIRQGAAFNLLLCAMPAMIMCRPLGDVSIDWIPGQARNDEGGRPGVTNGGQIRHDEWDSPCRWRVLPLIRQ